MKKTVFARALGVFLALLLAGCLSLPALAAIPQRPENQYVLDEARVLSEETERAIIKGNDQLFSKYGAEVVIVAVDFLGGRDIRDYTSVLFDNWGVGSQENNNGILLVMAIGEEDYFAQAGYGIGDYFDGARLQGLLDDYLEDDFAAGDYDQGALAFFQAARDELESYYGGGGQLNPPQEERQEYQEDQDFLYGSGFPRFLFQLIIRIVGAVAIIVVVAAVIRASRGGGGGYRGGGGGGGFWQGMMLGSMMNRRRPRWGPPPPPPPPGPFGGFGGPGSFGGPGPRPGGHSRPRPGPRPGGFGGGFHSGGGSRGGGAGRGGFGGRSGGGGGFHRGGGSHGGGAGRR